MIDHEQVYCDLFLNGLELRPLELQKISIFSCLDQPFRLVLDLSSSETPSFFSPRQTFSLKISAQDFGPYYFSGMLTASQLKHKTARGTYLYELILEPALASYRDMHSPYLFNGISILDIAKQILQGLNLNFAPNLYQNYQFNLLGDRAYPLLYRILMHDEDVLQFFTRILNYEGLSYYFDFTQAESPLVISDAINHFAPLISVNYGAHAQTSLSLAPSINKIFLQSQVQTQSVLSSGAPRLEPDVLLAHQAELANSDHSNTLYHLNINEQLSLGANLRSTFASLALNQNLNQLKVEGSGLLLAGMKLHIHDIDGFWLLHSSQIDIEFDAQHAYRLTKIDTQALIQSADLRYQTMPKFGEHARLFHGIALGTPTSQRGTNLISVNEQGHYHATLPDSISSNTEARDVHVFDIRVLHPMHSEDHSAHMTVPSEGEGVLLWSEGFSGEPLLMGSVNNIDNQHPTTEGTPQNAYWQDYDANKLGFVNQGQFDPNQSTGRKAASIMETPNYDLNSNYSYVRMGDALSNDSNYPSQAAEPGFFLNSSGHYSEEHQGGQVLLANNLDQNSQGQGFTSSLRHMVQLSPPLGTYHILDSLTAHTQNESIRSDSVLETYTQNEFVANKFLTAENHVQTYTADTFDNLYVNQQHQTSGDNLCHTFNQFNLSLQSQDSQIIEAGDSLTEQHDNYSVALEHMLNQVNTQTLQNFIDEQTSQISTLTQNFVNYTQQSNNSLVNTKNLSVNAKQINFGGEQTQTAMLIVNTG